MLGLEVPDAASGFASVERTWPFRNRQACDSNDSDSFKNQRELSGESLVNFVERTWRRRWHLLAL